jgi:hypothetical protein
MVFAVTKEIEEPPVVRRIPVLFAFRPAFAILLFLLEGTAFAQNIIILPDTNVCKTETVQRNWMHNIFEQAWNSIQRNPDDICNGDPELQVLNARAEDMFLPFAGKYIRKVTIINLSFERNFTDTSSTVKNLSTRIARTMHVNTREWVIRNNLFQKEGQKLDAYIMADNERYLRTLDYLQDARILPRSVPHHNDSVDVLVVVRDVFSAKIVLDNDGYSNIKARVSESNFLGMGQRIQATAMASRTRDPSFGYGFEYNKNNVCGTFAHVNLAYNNIDLGPSLGYEPEEASTISIYRPLPSPYDHYAGAFTYSTNTAMNVYRVPDSLWYAYSYNIFDLWGGYNLSLDHIMKHDSGVRDRKFLSLRYYRQEFTNNPKYFETRFDPVYNNKEAILAQLTFFRQEFIKTQYIYGFGITEDVPYGYNISVTAGAWRQNDLQRPYAGITVDYYTAHKDGHFCQYYLRAGAMKDGNRLDDAALMVGASRFSRLIFCGTDFKIRPYFRVTYARIFDPVTYEPLRLNNPFGLHEFGSDSAQGYERISFQTETVFFTRYKPYGFRLAPFVYVDGAFLRNNGEHMISTGFYPGLGGGLRTRNENLIFGTIEIKASYFPRHVDNQPTFKLLVSSDLRYRYRTTYIHAPDIVRMNSDEW